MAFEGIPTWEDFLEEAWQVHNEEVAQLGWHPASEKLPNIGEQIVTWVNHGDGIISVSRGAYVGWPQDIINKLWWCYSPKEE